MWQLFILFFNYQLIKGICPSSQNGILMAKDALKKTPPPLMKSMFGDGQGVKKR